MWWVIGIAVVVVLALVLLLKRRGATGPGAGHEDGLTPESTRISPHNHGIGGV